MDESGLIDEELTIDDDEFGIPEISPQTLESILAEPDNDLNLEIEGLSLQDSSDVSTIASLSVPGSSKGSNEYRPPELEALKNWETTSISSIESPINRSERGSRSVHGSVVSLNRMTILSENLKYELQKHNAGNPTAMAVSTKIAVGSSRGFVLIFDSQQTMQMKLGNPQTWEKRGGVSAVDFNTDVTRMLVGYNKGHIQMFDITNGKLLRSISDATTPGTCVLHVKFTDDLTLAVANDSGGSVYEMNFRRVMGVRSCESRCLFSGSKGEVCTVEPLHLHKLIADHGVRNRHMIAMATLTKVFVVALRPKNQVVFLHNLKMNPSSAPLIGWKMSQFSYDGKTCFDPILMFSRGDVVYFFHVKCIGLEELKFIHLRTMNLTYKIINFAWINTKTIMTVDTREQMHVVDVDTQQDVDVRALDHVKLMYNNATFKSIATGGNVSPALAAIGERACYHSVVGNVGTIYLLGTQSVYQCVLNTWKERVEFALTISHEYALQTAISFYNGTAKAVLGLSKNQEERKNEVSKLVLTILVEFVNLSMTSLCPDSGKLQVLIDFYRNVVPVCVDNCLLINKIDLLFTTIYERFRADCIAHGAFLECLEPYILNDSLKSINPEVVKDFIEHYQAKNMLTNIEKCLLHLNVADLDLNQVMHMCWGHGLYDAIFSIHSRGMNDFVTPFLELLNMLQSALKSDNLLSDKMTSLGNKLLVYISHCLAGISYPTGTLDEEQALVVKDQMFQCMTSANLNDKQLEGSYPVVSILLHFSTREFLNVLSLSFSSEYFTNEENNRIQCLVDILLHVMLENHGFKPDEVGFLFTFLARQSARMQRPLVLTNLLRQQIIEFLTTSGGTSVTAHEEKQQALIELIEAGVVDVNDDEFALKLIKMSEGAGFHRVLKMLHTRRRNYPLVFVACLHDHSTDSDPFEYVVQVLSDPTITQQEKTAIKSTVVENVKGLIELDSSKSASILTSLLNENVQDIVEKLEDNPKLLYKFLKGMFNKSEEKLDGGFLPMSMEASYFDSNNDEDTNEQLNYPNDPRLCEQYLDLMCRFDKENVMNFVRDCRVIRTKQALDLVYKYKIIDASVYLLEKSGDFNSAFNVLMKVANENYQDILRKIENGEQDISYDVIDNTIDSLVLLCQRSSKSLDEKQREKLWFSLLDFVLKPQNEQLTKRDDDFARFCKGNPRKVLNRMTGHINLSVVLQKIVQDPSYKCGEFSEIKYILTGMLDNYQYEKTLLSTTLNLMSRDQHKKLSQLRSSITQGLSSTAQYCPLCGKQLLFRDQNNNIVVFSNGKQYHENCLKNIDGVFPNMKEHELNINQFNRTNSKSGKDSLIFESRAKRFQKINVTRNKGSSRLRSSSLADCVLDKNFKLNTKAPSFMI